MIAGMRKVIFIVPFLLLALACGRDSNIPVRNVNLNLNLNLPSYQELNIITGWIYVSGGSKGIIVYRKSENEFLAYERHSPYQPEDNCRVSVGDDETSIQDECSDSQWSLIDGQVINGPASQPLLRYNTTWNDPYLTIRN
ncbi:Rieske (2Fe-2S) protein [Halocola ammonii]